MKHTVKLSCAVLASVACWAFASPALAQEAPKPMRGADVAAVDQAPEAKKYLGGKPGGQEKVARTFKEQPPVIPHAVENFDEITLEENQCLTCHSAANYQKKKAPKIGDSHFRDREGKVLPEASALRHNCVQCHVPQVDAPPLVDNDFKGNLAEGKVKAAKKKN
ncbi:nitrate reductase cytochrome c-type subunit [Dechloromonas sp. XY25]|uniref:Periplasmic nitrate reductase, electron transfer subunit n=1 Tax=Dechloromonas hankyongensis TaxID=2908002 RepID=A0ABS9JX26_9RHOO|nr:nitrate reductase cytochrome c-type subunit [Dechloromonas hankyongensis]MCG2575453.1 nitrate reductase cytochrome c-type subunit [Dechloromonas hankyongensis]